MHLTFRINTEMGGGMCAAYTGLCHSALLQEPMQNTLPTARGLASVPPRPLPGVTREHWSLDMYFSRRWAILLFTWIRSLVGSYRGQAKAREPEGWGAASIRPCQVI